MPLPGICPSCGAAFDLPAALTDAEARQALAAALQLPERLARLVVPYISLHSAGTRKMAWHKLSRLLTELKVLVTDGTVSRRGVTYAAPLETWRRALDEVMMARDGGSLILPLDGHGYLEEVAWRLASKAAGQGERRKTDRRSHLAYRTSQGGMRAAATVADSVLRSKEEKAKGLDATKKLKGHLK